MTRKTALRVLLAVSIPLYVGTVSALTPKPADTPTCTSEAGAAFNDGFAQGQTSGFGNGFNTAYPQGYDTGVSDAINSCQTDPQGCGIFLGSCIAAPQFGETEPNDNIVSADPLILDTRFWGQSYGSGDEDWFYVVTSAPNQTLTVSFSVPGGSVAGWVISIRDAAGNLFTEFDTGAVGPATSPAGDIAYRATLGLVGTYYVVAKPALGTLSYAPYNLAAILQDSPLETPNFVVGFHDAEVEPNEHPSAANPLATGVAMYGLINLAFDDDGVVSDVNGDGFEYAQGYDHDWYIYPTEGNELISIAICARDNCAPGNWLFEVYDETSAFELTSGFFNDKYIAPLLAYNSDTSKADQVVFGIQQRGNYYLRVTHKRLLTATCRGYTIDSDNDGLPDRGACACANGEASCSIKKLNPNFTVEVTCPDGSTPGEGDPPCAVGVPIEKTTYDLCEDGSGGGDSAQCEVGCTCTAFGGVIEVPANALTSQYNFTWHSTKLPPNTSSTDAYQDFLDRPSPY